MDPFEIQVKPTDRSSERCIEVHKVEKVRFIGINNHCWSIEFIRIALLPSLIIKRKAKSQVEVSEHKVAIFFPIQVEGPLKSIHGPQFKNGCTTGLHYCTPEN
jgi:hypothetical protein